MMRAIAALPFFAMIASACGSDHSTHMSGETLCAAETRDDTFVAGIAKSAGDGLTVKLVDSMPAPPIKGSNQWILEVTDSAGRMIDGATITVTPFMPDHGHGTTMKTEISPMGSGRYDATPVFLFMPGLWQVTIKVTKPNETDAKSVMFNFCVDG